jgi:hypothetical protein
MEKIQRYMEISNVKMAIERDICIMKP